MADLDPNKRLNQDRIEQERKTNTTSIVLGIIVLIIIILGIYFYTRPVIYTQENTTVPTATSPNAPTNEQGTTTSPNAPQSAPKTTTPSEANPNSPATTNSP